MIIDTFEKISTRSQIELCMLREQLLWRGSAGPWLRGAAIHLDSLRFPTLFKRNACQRRIWVVATNQMTNRNNNMIEGHLTGQGE